MRKIIFGKDERFLPDAVGAFKKSKKSVAITGAGISVESGIPDFRSPGGLWTIFSPDEYATAEVFIENPAKAWRLFREMGRTLKGKKPNPAHIALAQLEQAGKLAGVVTQNVDSLHQDAESRNVIEVHGDHRNLHCIRCGHLEPVREEHLSGTDVPRCGCGFALKPNVVLFGEQVRSFEEILSLLSECDALLVVGTSCQVYPVAALPATVKASGGTIFEFNKTQTALSRGEMGLSSFFASVQSDFLFEGNASLTVSSFVNAFLKHE